MEGSKLPDMVMALREVIKEHGKAFARAWMAFKVLAIVSAVIVALIYVTNDTRLEAIRQLSDAYAAVESKQGILISETEQIISFASVSGSLPTKEDLEEVRTAARNVLVAVSGMDLPSNRLRDARNNYRSAIERLMGAINHYDDTLDSYIAFQNASQSVANVGGEFRRAVEAFTGSTFGSFRAVL